MKRSIVYVILLYSLLLSSCQEEIADPNAPQGKYTYLFEGMNSPESKISVGDKVNDKWPLLWENGDRLGVFTSEGEFVGLGIVPDDDAGSNMADFAVYSDVALNTGDVLYFIYPYKGSVTFEDGRFVTVLSADQKQTSAGSSAGIGRNAVAYASAVYNGDKTRFVLSHANAYVRFTVSPGEFAGYDLNGITLWCDGQSLSGEPSVDVVDGSLEVSQNSDYVTSSLSHPVEMKKDGSYGLWLSVLPEDFSGKKLYAIVHMSKDAETVTLPVLLGGAGKLPSHTVTDINLPPLSKSLAPSWYEPVETRYIAAYGKGWAYGPQNTVLFTQSGVAKTVEFKARGNFMKVKEPKYIKVAYASDLSADKKSGSVYIGGADAYSSSYKEFALDKDCSASIYMNAYYNNPNANLSNIGQLAGLYVMDADRNVIWGTNLWLAVRPLTTTAFTNGTILDRNIGADVSPKDVSHWASNGCYFQWGRPWAFSWTAKLTDADKLPVDQTNTLEKSASHPYTFFYHDGEPYDWYWGDGSSSDRTDDLDDRWGNPTASTSQVAASSGMKSIYDPCPEGYMVASPSLLAEVEDDIASKAVTSTTPNYVLHNGVAFGFAGAYWGSLSGANLAKSTNTTTLVACWSNANRGSDGCMLSYHPAGNPQLQSSRAKTSALPVRCMVEVRDMPGSGGSTGSGSGGTSGGEIEDEETTTPEVPDDFEEEADDASADPSGTFDYSLLTKAGHPRLLTDAEGFARLKEKVTISKAANPTLSKLHAAILDRASKVVEQDRTFAVATDHYVIVDNLLNCAYAYRMTGNRKYLAKVQADIVKVCGLANWDPSGLAIGEISLALGLTYDWLYHYLTLEERKMIHKALVDKGIKPMYNNTQNVGIIGNWNQINLGGVSVASMAIYEKDKAVAVNQIEKALKGNFAGVTGIYKPSGNYGEGLGYWEYGGMFEACFLSSLEGIFGSTAGIAEIPGFMNSGEYALFMHGTMGTEFSYSDGGGTNEPVLLSSWWFAAQNNDPDLLFCEKRHMDEGKYTDTDLNAALTYRLLAPIVVSIKDFDMESKVPSPPVKEVWSGQGEMPVVMVRKGWNFDETDVYLGVKGGLADSWETSNTSHAHMDAGSFVFEAEGVRWSDDIMRPGYTDWFAAIKAAGSRSGDTSQKGLRWDTFHVSNLCHSTLVSYTNDGSVPDKLHSSDYYVDGFASIDMVINAAGRQGAVVNISSPLKGQVKSAVRTVELVNETDLIVTDEVTALDGYDCVLEWRMLSISSSVVSSSGVTLTKYGKKRTLTVVSSDDSVEPEYKSWPTTKPTTDGWGVLDFHQTISNRTIVGWSAIVPAGKTVKFVTALKK